LVSGGFGVVENVLPPKLKRDALLFGPCVTKDLDVGANHDDNALLIVF
jgi:hypothetical protein